ncbi:MAG: hypothetical protein ABL868_01510 [Sulfuriferula sp.]
MSYVKLIVGVLIAACAMPVWAGRGRDLRANDGYVGREQQNVVRDEPRQRNEVAPVFERNEGFGYGFERRHQQAERRGDFGSRERN